MAAIGSLEVGSTVKIKENGTPVTYIIVQQGLPSDKYDESCNGTWCLREDADSQMAWASGDYTRDYSVSAPNTWLNGNFLSRFDADTLDAIQSVKIPAYAVQAGKLQVKAFILSAREQNITVSGAPADGSVLAYFNVDDPGARRIANYNGTPVKQWTRSPYLLDSTGYQIWALDAYGGAYSEGEFNSNQRVRPVIILSSDTLVSDDGSLIFNEPPAAPGSITVPQVTAGDPVTLTWAAATDPDGTVVSYQLERSIDGSGWTQIYAGSALTYTDTVGEGWAMVQYRVRAEDDGGITGPYTASENQQVQAGVLYISGPVPNMGLQAALFSVQVSTGISGETEVVEGISLSVDLDGYALYAGEVETGQVVSFPIDPRAIGGGSHTIKAAAQKQDYITAIQIYSFSTPAVAFPSGGLGVQLQDEQGNPVFPQTSAALVQGIKGKSAGMNLQELYAGAFPTPDPSAAQLRKVTLSQTDLEAGVSPLATGELYFVYE